MNGKDTLNFGTTGNRNKKKQQTVNSTPSTTRVSTTAPVTSKPAQTRTVTSSNKAKINMPTTAKKTTISGNGNKGSTIGNLPTFTNPAQTTTKQTSKPSIKKVSTNSDIVQSAINTLNNSAIGIKPATRTNTNGKTTSVLKAGKTVSADIS